MIQPIPKLKIKRKTGHEHFFSDGSAHGFNLRDYWQWANSDLVSNITRGVLAEFIVARAVGIATDGVRDEWAPYDLETPDGIKLEVKSAAYIQSWSQQRFSDIRFGTKKTVSWNPETNTYDPEPRRNAHVYVFALLKHKDHSTIDPLNLDQWTFYVLPTAELDERKDGQHSMSLSALEKLASPVTFDELSVATRKAYNSRRRSSRRLRSQDV